jgi:hypothetical protein
MALFGQKEQGARTGVPPQGAQGEPQQEQGPSQAQAEEAADFLNDYTGDGLGDIGSNATAMSYLSITQDLSDCVKARLAEPGVFFNTGTQKVYGTEVRVVPLAFKTVWDERDAAGKTVDRYEPYTIEVTEVAPKPGNRFPTLVNPKTGNKVIETFAYAVMFPDDPGAGFAMMTAGVGSMRAFRRWNTSLRSMVLPNGKPAPLYGKVWRMIAGTSISKTTGKPYYSLETVREEGWVTNAVFNDYILPAREESSRVLLAAPVVADDESKAASSDTAE